MVIYGEYLFLENFLTGVFITYFTVRICGGERGKGFYLRVFVCGLLCGLYAFTMFAQNRGLWTILQKVGFVLIVSRTAFGKTSAKRLISNGFLFFAVTVLYGGITLAFLTSFGWEGISGRGGVYLPFATYLTVTAAAAAAALAVWFLADFIRIRRQEMRTAVDVTICMGEEKVFLQGFIDSGNFLTEPLTGKPVAVAKASAVEKLLGPEHDWSSRYTAIPFRAVGTEKGILDGYRADEMVVGGKIIKKPVLAICRDIDFLTGRNDRGQILLPESMLERGIYAEFE